MNDVMGRAGPLLDDLLVLIGKDRNETKRDAIGKRTNELFNYQRNDFNSILLIAIQRPVDDFEVRHQIFHVLLSTLFSCISKKSRTLERERERVCMMLNVLDSSNDLKCPSAQLSN